MPNPTAAPLPCPHCDARDIYLRQYGQYDALQEWVCRACGASAPNLAAWNRRAPSPSREGWLTREEVEQELLHIEAHEAPNHAMPRLFALTLCRMALSALEVK